jgi:hypothetical protein
VRWPTRFHEHLVRPFPLSVHDWRLTGLDVNRGLRADEVSGPEAGGRAAAPAYPVKDTASIGRNHDAPRDG